MELMQLEMFVAVAEGGSILKASERVFRTQPAVTIAIKKLENEINAKLFREDKHWSYGARTGFQFARGESAWVASAPVQTDKTKESLVELNKEIRDVSGARPISQAELDKDKANRTLRLAGSRETVSQVGEAMETIVKYGFPDD